MGKNKHHIVSPGAYEVHTSNRYRIPTRDGIELGATITRPTAPGRFPTLVWYEPYRTAADGRADEMAEYFARRGYNFAYVHVRGTGNSQGVSMDEYMAEETRDGYDAIEWLAAQPWSNGKVGMLGSSYSGFTTLQVAALAPPSLKAIAPAYFTDRRYTDDCHYKGGCLRGYYDLLTYGLGMVVKNALPPFPEAVDAQWSELWRQRLERSEPYLLRWLQHPVEDEYWTVGSIAGRVHHIRAAALLMGGWNDGYPNPPLRVYRELTVPKRLLMGPWLHAYPDRSHCGPRIHCGHELLRWWDHWLKDMDNGVTEEPPVIVYEQEWEPPRPDRLLIAGRWRTTPDLPAAAPRIFHLHGETLTEAAAGSPGSASVRYLPAASRNGGLWSGGLPFALPGEQSEDCARAINFTLPPLSDDLSILGNPTFRLYLSADAEVIPVAVRLLDVAPDGTSVLVTKGILNATRRAGMDAPQPLRPGVVTPVTYHLEATAWRFRKGHRIRVSVNGSDFPNVWPTPCPGTLTLHWGPEHPSQITLPVWSGGEDPPFEFLPSPYPPKDTGSGRAPWQIVHDVLEDQYRLVLDGGRGEMGVSHREPARAWARARAEQSVQWTGVHIRARATATLSSDAACFILNVALQVDLNDALYFQRHWSCTVPRRLL